MPADVDRIERLLGAWRVERPDLDVDTMILVARLLAVAHLVADGHERAARRGADAAAADVEVLFALCRGGPPFRAMPSRLATALLVPGPTMTSRLDRLEHRGLVRRVPSSTDRRSVVVELTEAGRRLADEAVGRHVADERALLEPLRAGEQTALSESLRRLLLAHDTE